MSPTKRSGLQQESASAVLARTPSKSKKSRKGKTKEPALSPQETLDARKDALIQEKRTEGTAVADRHENMVSPPLRDSLSRFDKVGTRRAAS